MDSIKTHDEVRDFLKKLRDFMPDDLLVEFLRIYGLRDVLAYAMNLESGGPGPERIKHLIETRMAIEYIKIPDIYDYLMFNVDNERVYAAKNTTRRTDIVEIQLTSLSFDIKESYEVSYGEELLDLAEFFTNDGLYFSTPFELVELDYKHPEEEAKTIQHSMGEYVQRYLIDEQGQVRGFYLNSSKDKTTLFGVVTFYPGRLAFDLVLNVDLSKEIFQGTIFYLLAIYGDNVYLKVEDKNFPSEQRVMAYNFIEETFESILVDPDLEIISAELSIAEELNIDKSYLLVIASKSPNTLVYHYFDLQNHKMFSRQVITMNPGGPLLDVNVIGAMSDYNGVFFWHLSRQNGLDYNVVAQRLVSKTRTSTGERSKLLKEFTEMPIAQQKSVCRHYFNP